MLINIYAEDRNRTGTIVSNRRILSPVRLPVPPPRPLSERRDSNPRPPPWQGGVLPLNYVRIDLLFYIKKCRLHDLNTRPSDYKSDALPTELSRLIIILLCGLRDLNPHAVKRQILNLVRLPIPPNPQNMTRTGLEPVTH